MKKILFVIAIVLVLALAVTVSACKTTPAEPDIVVGQENMVAVSDAMNIVYSAMKESSNTGSAFEGIYISFNGEKKSVDSTLAVNPKPTLYDFSAKAYIDDENISVDTKSTLAFTVKEENGAVLFAMYYSNGTLYLDYPPIFNKVAISGLNLGAIVKDLNQSRYEGKFGEVSDLLTVLGNYVFTSCKKVVLGKCDDPTCRCKSHYEYVCSLDFSKVYDAFESVLNSAKLGIDADMLLGALNLTRSDLNHLGTLKTTMSFNVYDKVGASNVYYFKSASFDQKEATVTDTLTIDNLFAIEFAPSVAGDYKVVLADNLSTYRAFSFANYDISGKLTMSVNSSNARNTLFGNVIDTALVKNDYSCNYSLKSNYSAGKLTFSLSLTELFGTQKYASLYFDGDNLFVDLSSLIGEAGSDLGLLSFDKEFIDEKLKTLSLLNDKIVMTDNDIAYSIVSLLSGLDHTADKTDLTIDTTALNSFIRALGIGFVFDYQSAKLSVDTSSNLFKSLSVELIGNGISFGLTSDNPKVGYEVLVEKPDWVSKCVGWSDLTRITPVVKGRISTNVNGVSNVRLVEALIESLTGENVTLSGSVSKFVAESNYSTDGELQIFKLSFYSSDDDFVCALYYRAKENDARSNKLYVILPEKDGKDPVLALDLVDSGRYSGLLGLINGNALVVSGESSVILSNDSNGLKLSANREGIDNVLSFIKQLLPDLYLTELPIDFAVDRMALSFGKSLSFTTVFAQNKHITLDVDDVVLDYYGLGVKTSELNGHKDKVVSIFDDNDLKDVISIEMYGKNDYTLVIDVDSFGGWKFEKTFALGSGIQTVDAYVTVFGKKITESVKVDCSEASEYSVKVAYEYLDYVNNNDKSFVFPKFLSPVDPVYVITEKFNSVDLKVGNTYINKKVDWKYNGATLTDANFGYGSTFTVTPSILGYFNAPIELRSCSYSLTLSGDEADKIENADSFITIWAYDEYAPLEASTYAKAPQSVLTKLGDRLNVSLEWDVDSIINLTIRVDGKLLSNDELKEALAQRFYMLDGTYRISAYLSNSLGVKTQLNAIVTVVDRIITDATFVNMADGVEFEPIQDEKIKGLVILDPSKIDSIGSTTGFSKEIQCVYGDVTKIEKTIKWEIPSLNNVPLYSATPVQNDFAVVIGDAIGGFQSFTYHYIFKSYDVTDIALTNGNLVISDKSVSSTDTTFTLDNLNPYDFVFPTGVVFDYREFTLTYKTFTKTYPASKLTYDDVNWQMNDLVENEIWRNGETVVYKGSFSLRDRKVNLELSFVKAEIDTWVFLDQSGKVTSPDSPLLTTPTYREKANGEFVLVDGRFIKANETHIGLVHYEQVQDEIGLVYYKRAAASDTTLSLTLDPNKSNYLCYDSYPSMARVSFKNLVDGSGNPIYFDLPLVWDLSALEQATDIRSNGYYETVPVYVAYGQKMADVHLWISGTDPSDYYFVFNSDGSVFADDEIGELDEVIRTKIISLKLLNTDANGNLFVKNLNDVRTIHQIVCGCDDEQCLGKIYFKYNDVNTRDGWFAVTEWQGLEKIAELYKTQIANGVPVNEVSGKVEVTAKVGNISCSAIILSIERCPIVSPSYQDYLPLVNSSIDNSVADVYSMHIEGDALVIDPYLANPKDENYYPQKVSFYLNGKETVASLKGWDCSCFDQIESYKGANGTVYALIDTVFGNVRIETKAIVKARIIELVYVDGSALPRINVNVYSENPFGENVVRKNGRTIAYKRVDVKFVGDDSRYPMILKYDVTDFVAKHSGGCIASNITVSVGNDAGGYQTKTGYSVYSTQNSIISIVSDDENVLAYLPDGVIYSSKNGFTAFADENDVLTSQAWKSLLVNVERLTVTYSYYANSVEVVETVVVNKRMTSSGIEFKWVRDDDGKVLLIIWNGRTDAGNVSDELQISTGTDKKIKLSESDFNLNGFVDEREFTEDFTVGEYIDGLAIASIPQTMIAKENIVVELLDENGNVLSLDVLLNSGNYSVRISVTDDRFSIVDVDGGETITKRLTVTQKTVSDLIIMNGDRRIFVSSNSYEVYEGVTIALAVSVKEGFAIDIVITDQNGNAVTEIEEVGTYTVTFVSTSPNYRIAESVYTITVRSREITEPETSAE